jgi:4-amino-4-deoxy-L-arabinose transferase-like glycosyltransferase
MTNRKSEYSLGEAVRAVNEAVPKCVMPPAWVSMPLTEVCGWVILIGAAFLLRLGTALSAPVIETDGVRYALTAQRFWDTGLPFDPLFHPLYPVAMAVFHILGGGWEFAGRAVSLFCGTLTVLVAAFGTRRLFGPRIAFLVAALLAVHPGMVASSAAVLSEAMYTLLLLLAAMAAWGALIGLRTSMLLPLAGLGFGLAYLVRPEAVLYLGGVFLLALIQQIRVPEMRRSWLSIPFMLATFLGAAGPYLLYLRRTLGYWTLSGKVLHNLVQDTGMGAAGAGDMAFIVRHAATLGQRVIENLFLFEKYALPELLPGIIGFFLLPGLFLGWRWVDGPALIAPLLALCLPPLATLPFHVEARVFLPILPFLLPLAGLGIEAVARWLSPTRSVSVLAACLTGLVVVATLPYTLKPMLRPDVGAGVYREAAAWIRTSQPADTVIMDRKPFVAFYATRQFVPLPDGGAAELSSAARRAGATVVVLDSRTLGDRPRLVPLLYQTPPDGLRLLVDFDRDVTTRLRLLEIDRRE